VVREERRRRWKSRQGSGRLEKEIKSNVEQMGALAREGGTGRLKEEMGWGEEGRREGRVDKAMVDWRRK
jgi:hypothetical protein